jgi:hypothetical protein
MSGVLQVEHLYDVADLRCVGLPVVVVFAHGVVAVLAVDAVEFVAAGPVVQCQCRC